MTSAVISNIAHLAEPALTFLSGAAIAALIAGFFSLRKQKREGEQEHARWLRETRRETYAQLLVTLQKSVTELFALADEMNENKIAHGFQKALNRKPDFGRTNEGYDRFLNALVMTILVANQPIFDQMGKLNKILNRLYKLAEEGAKRTEEPWSSLIEESQRIRRAFITTARESLAVEGALTWGPEWDDPGWDPPTPG